MTSLEFELVVVEEVVFVTWSVIFSKIRDSRTLLIVLKGKIGR